MVTDYYSSALLRTGDFESVMSWKDVVRLLDLQQQQQITDCDDSCQAEVSGALGVTHMAVGSFGVVGNKTVVNLPLIGPASAQGQTIYMQALVFTSQSFCFTNHLKITLSN